MRNILALTFNDFAIALKNKTIYLILFIPFFVFISLKLIDQPGTDVSKIRIGLIQKYAYAPLFTRSVKAAERIIEVTWVQNEEEGKRLLKEKKIDGVLVRNEKEPDSLALLVLKKESPHTLAIVECFSALQKTAEVSSVSWITDVKPLYEGGIQRQTLPAWILMLVLLVGFIILPAQVAEEKEKKLLLALLQTPIREVQWLIAKLIMGMVLMIMAILFLHLLGKFTVANLFSYSLIHCRREFLFQRLRDLPGFSLPQSGKRQNPGPCLLFAAPSSLRPVRFFETTDHRCTFHAVLPVLRAP